MPPHATGNVQLFCAVCIVLIPCISGIAAANSSHVKQFPNVASYNDFYYIVVDTCEISVDRFAMLVQRLLVEYLRACWCERFWTGDHGRYCLVHSWYAGCNNNMGMEVTWLDIKKSYDSLGTLGAFIRTLCRFIATAMKRSPGRGEHEAP